MKTFHCTKCHAQVFFENVTCLHCGYALAYLPDRLQIVAFARDTTNDLWTPEGAQGARYRLCQNYATHGVCNWAVSEVDRNPLCVSCYLTRVIPQLTPAGKEAWSLLEAAKRRLVHALLTLQLPLERKDDANPSGVIFEFLKDSTRPNGDTQRVMTGHDNGVITLNVGEADDVQRERQRANQHEPYRTLLGHFRHEIGHYFWDRMIQDSYRRERFRSLFGDERKDYAQALQHHYASGAPPGWRETHISAYATSHPWEDWAESWAHFLHMSDALETAAALGVALQPASAGEPVIGPLRLDGDLMNVGFEAMIAHWLPLTYMMNSLSRGLGLADSYPFVLSPTVIDKIRFIYETISEHRASGRGQYT